LIESIRNDPIVSFLLQKSSITPTQLDTIMASQIEGNLDAKISSREKAKVSKGAFVRTLRQGQENIESSIYTIMLVVYLGIVPEEKFDQFLRTQRLFSRVKEVGPDRESMMRLISGMKEFVENFSGRASQRKVIL
jgi:hypothetical protein